jgi:HPt (histidine-containing phosphotransfer) domain-containing protein
VVSNGVEATDANPGMPHAISDAQASLRQTFASEVDARLARLESLGAGDESVLDDARRDAHSLASGAVIVDEPEIARLAQAVELDPLLGPVDELLTALRGYAP